MFVLQKVSEKVGGAEGTKLDVDFTEMEKARLNSFLISPCWEWKPTPELIIRLPEDDQNDVGSQQTSKYHTKHFCCHVGNRPASYYKIKNHTGPPVLCCIIKPIREGINSFSGSKMVQTFLNILRLWLLWGVNRNTCYSVVNMAPCKVVRSTKSLVKKNKRLISLKIFNRETPCSVCMEIKCKL